MKLFIAEVIWYDSDVRPGPINDKLVVAAESFEVATSQIMSYFGEEGVEDINLTLINPNRPLALIDKATYEGLKEAEI